jgi:hypothetical protein
VVLVGFFLGLVAGFLIAGLRVAGPEQRALGRPGERLRTATNQRFGTLGRRCRPGHPAPEYAAELCDVDGNPQNWVGAERADALTSAGVSSAADGDRFQQETLCTEAVVWDA